MNDEVEVQNAYSHFCKRVSDTERSNRLMQVTKQFLRCVKPLTLTPSVFLLSKLLAAVGGGNEREGISAWGFSESWARGYANMQQAYQSAALIFKLQVPKANCKIHNATQQMHRMASAVMHSCSPVAFDGLRTR